MGDMVNVIKVAKVVDSHTFQPKLRCIVDIDIEPMKETGVLFKDGYIEKKFYTEFINKVAKAYENTKDLPASIFIYPDQLDRKDGSGEADDFLNFPQKWIYMNQMLRPVVSVGGQNLQAKSFKMLDFISGQPEFMDNTHKLKELVTKAQEFLEDQGCEFFYYILLQKHVNTNTLDVEYTVLVRGV